MLRTHLNKGKDVRMSQRLPTYEGDPESILHTRMCNHLLNIFNAHHLVRERLVVDDRVPTIWTIKITGICHIKSYTEGTVRRTTRETVGEIVTRVPQCVADLTRTWIH